MLHPSIWMIIQQGNQTIQTQIAEDLQDTRLYVIKASMCVGRDAQGGNGGKRRKADCNEHFNWVFSHAPFSESLCLVCDPQVYCLGLLLLLPCAYLKVNSHQSSHTHRLIINFVCFSHVTFSHCDFSLPTSVTDSLSVFNCV